MIYTVTMNPALDQTVGAGGERLDPGGKGLNVSKTLLAFGVPSVAAGIAGGVNGGILCHLAQQQGVTLAMFPAQGETRLNRKIFDGQGVTEENQPGAPFEPEVFAALRAWLGQTLRTGDRMALCGSLPPGAPAECYAMLCREASDSRVVADVSGAALEAILVEHPWAVKPNLAELSQWAACELPDQRSRIAAMKELLARGAQRVLLSLGAAGAMLATPAGVWMAEAPTVPVRGTVGAGDAMTAVLTWMDSDEPAALLRCCVAAGSAAVMQPGSQPPRWTDVQTLQQQVSVRRLVSWR